MTKKITKVILCELRGLYERFGRGCVPRHSHDIHLMASSSLPLLSNNTKKKIVLVHFSHTQKFTNHHLLPVHLDIGTKSQMVSLGLIIISLR